MLRAVIIDSREPKWVAELDYGVPTTVQQLPCGDVWAQAKDATIVVERKTISDLCTSIADGRLFDQAQRMIQASQWCYVVATMPVIRSGYVVTRGKLTGWRWPSVQGALLTLDDIGVPTVWIQEQRGFHQTIQWLASRDRSDVTVKQQQAPRRGVMRQPVGEAVLCSLPNISSVRAQALLDHCGSAAWALQYLSGDAEGVEGVGRGTKKAARAALGLSDDLQIIVVAEEG